jgi:hypothetical protein
MSEWRGNKSKVEHTLTRLALHWRQPCRVFACARLDGIVSIDDMCGKIEGLGAWKYQGV